MKSPRRMIVGARSTHPSTRSFSRGLLRTTAGRVTGATPGTTVACPTSPRPPAIGRMRRPSLMTGPPSRSRLRAVDLFQLGLGPLHRFLGRHALDGLRVHVDDDVLRIGLGGLRVRGASPSEEPELARGVTVR